MHGTVFSVFVDSRGNIYASPWTGWEEVQKFGVHGHVVESRDGGRTWRRCADTHWPTGVAWRWAEDSKGNVFFGEYSATIPDPEAWQYRGTVWRRGKFGDGGEAFEIVFQNPSVPAPDTYNNHIHYVGVDPYTDYVYAAIGDGAAGRFIRSKHHGEPGSWYTLETGVDSQYTAAAFTPDFLFLGTDTNRMHKKLIRWDKTQSRITGIEPFWTTDGMDRYPEPPRIWTDKGNWFWGHYFEDAETLAFNYMPYSLDPMDDGLMQPPRVYASADQGETWWRAVTLPPAPIRSAQIFGENGPKMSSNIGPDGWVYASRGTVDGTVQSGFRFRMAPPRSGGVPGWDGMK